MADEQKTPDDAKGGGKKLMRSLIVFAAVILVAGAAGIAAFMFILSPMLNSDASAAPAPMDDAIPMGSVEVPFETTFVNLIMPNEDMPTSTLLFSMTLSCANQLTADIINAHKARFSDMIIKLHDGRTRAEVVSDPRLIKESIQKQVVQEASQLLRRLQGNDVDDSIKVLAALHTQFAVSDSI